MADAPRATGSRPLTGSLQVLGRPGPAALALALFCLLVGLAWLRHGAGGRLAVLIPLLAALSAVAVTDLCSFRIPDLVTLPGLVYALVTAAAGYQPAGLVRALVGLLVCGGLLLVAAVVTRGGIGGGDIKLMALLGAALGWERGLVALAASQVVGAVGGVTVWAFRGRRAARLVPVGSLMAVTGALLLILNP